LHAFKSVDLQIQVKQSVFLSFSINLNTGAHKDGYISLFQQKKKKKNTFTCPPVKHLVSLGFSRGNALSAPDNSSKATMPWFQTRLDTSWEAGPKVSKANRQNNHLSDLLS